MFGGNETSQASRVDGFELKVSSIVIIVIGLLSKDGYVCHWTLIAHNMVMPLAFFASVLDL